MRRLIDGAHAILKLAPEQSEICDLDKNVLGKVPPENMDALASLAQGESDHGEASSLFLSLEREGLARGDLPATDPLVEERLAELGRGFAWSLPEDERGPELTALLRRSHARRKSFLFAFGQTYCLPESGIARCLHVSTWVPKGGKVLLVGDDDLLSLPLAAMGYDVTTFDIDELVIGFLKHAAQEEGLKVDARVYDVLAPLDQALLNTFDAVFTDPMSYEMCFLAFWSRGLAVLKPGGRLVTCVQPYTRHLFESVQKRLPADVARYRYRFSGYYTYHFAENLYRSDLVEMVKNDGALPYPTEERIPFEDITEGMISAGYHSLGEVAGMRMALPKNLNAEMISQALVSSGRYQVIDAGHTDQGQFHHSFLSLEDGGHLAVVLDSKRAQISFNGFPWHEEREHWLMRLFQRTVRGVKTGLWYADAPRLPARPVIINKA